MGPATAIMASLLLSISAQGEIAPRTLPGSIAPRTPPGSVRVPGVVQVRVHPTSRIVAHDLREARQTIERRRENGELSRREARKLRREIRRVAHLAHRYSRDGLSENERRELELRSDVLKSRSAAPRL